MKHMNTENKVAPKIYAQQDFLNFIRQLNERNHDKVLQAYTMGYEHGQDDAVISSKFNREGTQ